MSQDKWREQLSEEAFRVCRMAGTERPFTGALLDETREGTYVCKCCQAPLFPSDTKFDAGCGWPSFFAQLPNQNVGYREDNSLGMQRIEIFCNQCGSHLGHVFPDGPKPSGQRYCVNSISLTFQGKDKTEVEG